MKPPMKHSSYFFVLSAFHPKSRTLLKPLKRSPSCRSGFYDSQESIQETWRRSESTLRTEKLEDSKNRSTRCIETRRRKTSLRVATAASSAALVLFGVNVDRRRKRKEKGRKGKKLICISEFSRQIGNPRAADIYRRNSKAVTIAVDADRRDSAEIRE